MNSSARKLFRPSGAPRESPPVALLMRCVLENDPVAWTDLLTLAENQIVVSLRKKGIGEADLKDVCQKILVKVYRKLHTLERAGSFQPWLNSIVNTTVLDVPKWAGFRERFEPSIDDPYGHRFHICPLPKYSPEFNAIEPVWHYVRVQATHNRYYATEKEFVTQLDNTFCRIVQEPSLIQGYLNPFL